MYAAWLFGMETSVLETCNQAERSRFSLLAMVFTFLVAVCFLSLLYLCYLLVGKVWLSILLSILLTFVYFNILRFSIISIGVPHSSQVTFKKLIFNSGNIARLLIFSAFIFSICVPFVSFFYHKNITPKIDQYKFEILRQFEIAKQQSKDHQLSYLNDAIQYRKNELNKLKLKLTAATDEQNALIKFQISKIAVYIQKLEKEYQSENFNLTEKISRDIKKYRFELKQTEMPFMRFRHALSASNSLFFILLSFLFFMSLIPFYIHTLVGRDFVYSKKTHAQATNLIKLNYDNSIQSIQEYLKDRFGYTEKIVTGYSDAPFNTIPDIGIGLKIKDQDLFTYFEIIDNRNGETDI
jgi:hypothetical protein